MKLSIPADALASAASSAARFRARAGQGVTTALVSAHPNGTVRLAAQTRDAWGVVTVAASVDQPGDTCVDPVDLGKVAATLGNATVHLRLAGRALVLDTPRGEFRFNTEPVENWPPIPAIPVDTVFSPLSLDAVGRVAHAVAKDDARYGLNGLHAERVTDGYRLVATDGHRLAYAGGPGDGPDLRTGDLISREAVEHLTRLGGAVEAATVPGHLLVRTGDVVAAFRLIDGTFPDYRAIVPATGAGRHRIVIDTAALSAALNRAAVAVAGRDRAVIFDVVPGRVGLSISNVDFGQYAEDVAAEVTGEPVLVGFNLRYLRDALTHRGPTTVIEFAGPLAPTLVRDPEPGGTADVVMPMKLDNEVAVGRPVHDWRAA